MLKYLLQFLQAGFIGNSIISFIITMLVLSVIGTTVFLSKFLKIKQSVLKIVLLSIFLQAVSFGAIALIFYFWQLQWIPLARWFESIMGNTESFVLWIMVVWGTLFTIVLPLLSFVNWCILKRKDFKTQAFPALSVSVKATMLAMWSFWSLFLIIFGMFLLSWSLTDACYQARRLYHEFDAHLKTVCVESDKPGECPRSEAELMAFHPENYRRIQTCAFVEYTFEENTQEYLWVVRFPGIFTFVSSRQSYPGFGSQ